MIAPGLSSLLGGATVVLSLFILSAPAAAQDRAASVDTSSEVTFRFVVTTPELGIDLTCEVGCAWTRLAFPAVADDEAVLIDEFGIVGQEARLEVRPEMVRFLIALRRTDEGVVLEGFEGTAWRRLTYTCPTHSCAQAIDRTGVTR